MAVRQGKRRPPKSSQHYTPKTRGNYRTGGWCRRRRVCPGDGAECDGCYMESVWKESERNEAKS